jgi:hypothetical protein
LLFLAQKLSIHSVMRACRTHLEPIFSSAKYTSRRLASKGDQPGNCGDPRSNLAGPQRHGVPSASLRLFAIP